MHPAATIRASTLFAVGIALVAAGIYTPGWSLAVIACLAVGGASIGLALLAMEAR